MTGLLEANVTELDYRVFGKVGDPNYAKGLPPGSEGYSVLLTKFEPSDEEIRIEELLAPLFPKHEKPKGRMRIRTWNIENGGFIFSDMGQTRAASQEARETGVRIRVPITTDFIPGAALRSETIPPKLVPTLKMIIGIESRAHEYTRTAFRIFSPFPTLLRIYHGWDEDESLHEPAVELVAVETGALAQDEIDEFLGEVAEREWTPPFKTVRQMMLYPFPQEGNTAPTYTKLISGIRPTAPLSAEALHRSVEPDEYTHRGLFRRINTVLGIMDRKGTAADIFYVYEHFGMPGDAIMPNPMQNMRAFRQLGIDRRFIARELYRCMDDLNKDVGPDPSSEEPFLDMERARDLVCYYAGAATDDESVRNLLSGRR